MRSTIHREDEDDENLILKEKITENIENNIKTVFDIDSKNIETEKLINLQNSLNQILKEQENIKKMIPKSGGNTIINNKLSINLYLNTECKKAMSIQDFLNQLKISLDDLNYTKNNGFVEGISNVFVKAIG